MSRMPGPIAGDPRDLGGLGVREGCLPLCATPGAADAPSRRRLGLPALRLARLFIAPLPAHVGQDAGPLNLAPELTESSLQVLALCDVDFQLCATSAA